MRPAFETRTYSMTLRIALAATAFAGLAALAAPASADGTTQIRHTNAECYVMVTGGTDVDCKTNTKFPNKKIDFAFIGSLDGGKPVKFRNPTAKCMLSWFDGKPGCFVGANDPSDKSMIWKVFDRDGKGYQIQNVGANCWLSLDPDGLACVVGKPGPEEDAYLWNLLG